MNDLERKTLTDGSTARLRVVGERYQIARDGFSGEIPFNEETPYYDISRVNLPEDFFRGLFSSIDSARDFEIVKKFVAKYINTKIKEKK